jgi:hypothetical protein
VHCLCVLTVCYLHVTEYCGLCDNGVDVKMFHGDYLSLDVIKIYLSNCLPITSSNFMVNNRISTFDPSCITNAAALEIAIFSCLNKFAASAVFSQFFQVKVNRQT